MPFSLTDKELGQRSEDVWQAKVTFKLVYEDTLQPTQLEYPLLLL
jgi:hypothetical protein